MKRGEQHYKFISHFHRTKERFELDKYKDKLKQDYCK